MRIAADELAKHSVGCLRNLRLSAARCTDRCINKIFQKLAAQLRAFYLKHEGGDPLSIPALQKRVSDVSERGR